MGILSLKSFLSLVLLTGPLFSVQAALFTDPKDLPRTEYDFIVIGGNAVFKHLTRGFHRLKIFIAGTAGNVVASRLSEDSSKSVLVVEAGLELVFLSLLGIDNNSYNFDIFSDANIELVQVPFFAPTTPETLVDWNYTPVPQPGINGRSLEVPRGFVLGGSSSLSKFRSFNIFVCYLSRSRLRFHLTDYMIWTQASRDLFDSYANVTGDKGWGWDEIQPLWKKVNPLSVIF